MHSISFPYKQIDKRYMPIIPIILYGSKEAIGVEAYVDSGAIFSVFSVEVAKELKITLKDAREQYLVVGEGGAWLQRCGSSGRGNRYAVASACDRNLCRTGQAASDG